MSQANLTFEDSLSRVRDLLNNADQRVIIGIVGKPGAGKSTLSDFLMKNLPADLVSLVPMDGYHLSNKVLENLMKSDRKGAPDTFDAMGFAALLDRIRKSTTDIYYPIFHREIEESIAAEGVVKGNVKLVIVEGNYLLHNSDGWEGVKEYFSEVWFVDIDNEVRLKRLVDRHIQFGKEEGAAFEWAHGTDERNATLVEATKYLVDFIIINN